MSNTAFPGTTWGRSFDIPRPAGTSFANAGYCGGTPLPHVQPGAPRDPQVLFRQAALQLGGHRSVLMYGGLFLPRWRVLQLPLLRLLKFLSVHFCGLSETLCKLAPSLRSLMKRLSSTGPRRTVYFGRFRGNPVHRAIYKKLGRFSEYFKSFRTTLCC